MRGAELAAAIGVALGAATCGGNAAAPPVVELAPVAPIERTSCGDAGVILRGAVPSSENEEAARAGEVAIAVACARGHWPPELLACIGRSRKPQSCLDRLPPSLAADYQAAVAEWRSRYFPGDDDLNSDASQIVAASVSCQAVADQVEHYSDDVAVERPWVLAARKRLVERACTAGGWQESTKHCLVDIAAPHGLVDCVAGEPNRYEVQREVDALGDQAVKIAAARAHPAAIACAKAAAGYYDAKAWDARPAWKATLASAAARGEALAAARGMMQRACGADGWSEDLRACLATGGGDDCFAGVEPAGGPRWPYPELLARLGAKLPESCWELAEQYARERDCAQVSPDQRDALEKDLAAVSAFAQSKRAAQKQAIADMTDECKAFADAAKLLPQCP